MFEFPTIVNNPMSVTMAEEKSEITHQEQIPGTEDEGLASEDEPASIYQIGWRTMMAVVALSMSNNCAAITNTAGVYHLKGP